MKRALAMLAVGPCGQEPPPEQLGPCDAERTAVEVAPPYGDYGDFVAGSELWCGNPPQGGAPYSPFRLRVLGPEALEDGVQIEMSATDPADGVELAWTSLTMGVTCANVGESAGYWVGSEAHMRYSGWSLAELGGRSADVTIAVSALSDPAVSAHTTVNVEIVADE